MRIAHFRIKLDESGFLLSIVLLEDLNEGTDAWVGATSSSVDRVIATLGHIVGSVVNIFHRWVHVPHGSCIFSRVEPGGFYCRLTRPRDMRSRAEALYSYNIRSMLGR